jgi:hypothetical protein
MLRREELLIQLEREERHLSALQRDVEGVLRRIEGLRAELDAQQPRPDMMPGAPVGGQEDGQAEAW